MENDINKLIFGKSNLNAIVGLEVNDGHVEIFTQDQDGNIISEFKETRYWLLSSSVLGSGAIRLNGDLHYKYGYQFEDRKDWSRTRAIWKEKDIFSIYNPEEACMVKDGYSFFQGLKHKDVSILSFDIETNGVQLNSDSKTILISNTFRDSKGIITKKLFSYDEYETQQDMINYWCDWVRLLNPSILAGHNVLGFDLPFLNHCSSHGLKLGRDDSYLKFDDYESRFRKDGSQFIHYKKAKIYGRTVLDTMFLSIKYDVGRKYESYGLKNIIKQEGLEKKDRVFYDASTIRFNYNKPEEMKKIKAYAIDDADDALALYDLMSPPFFYMAQSIPKTFEEVMLGATGSQINSIMMRAYLQDKHSIPKADEAVPYEGAISFGNTGIYNNVHKVDVASLYPSIMIEYEVCDEEKDPKRYFLELVKTFTSKRLEYKKKAKEDKYYDDLQGAYKIFINSCYGFLGTSGLSFNCPSAAAYITTTGRQILQTSIDWAKSKKYFIVNADTDSISYASDSNCLQSEDVRKTNIKDLNSLFPPTIRFEDDGFFHKVIIFKAKNYVLYDGKKIKTKGSALKDSKKELALKDFQGRVIDALVFDKGTSYIQDIYNEYVKEITFGLKDIKQWCSKKTITDKIFNSERTNETKVKDAIVGADYKEGDKIWVYFKEDESLALLENYDGSYHKDKFYEKLYKASELFEAVLPENLFINYKLKKNKKLLEELFSIKEMEAS